MKRKTSKINGQSEGINGMKRQKVDVKLEKKKKSLMVKALYAVRNLFKEPYYSI